MEEVDKLKLYMGEPYIINDYISINMPKLRDIVEYGERDFYEMVFSIVERPTNMKWQLWDVGIDWTKLDYWTFFTDIIAPTLTRERTSILFGNILDFSIMKKTYNKDIDSYVLVQDVAVFDDEYNDEENDYDKNVIRKIKHLMKTDDSGQSPHEYQIVIDKYTYNIICKIIRDTYGFEEKHDMPANEVTKIAQIEDEKEYYLMNKDKPYESSLINYISAMVNSSGFKRDDITVFDMNIYAFMDSVKRISKIKNAELLLQSGYSGFGIDLKEIDKKEIEWAGDI